MKIISEWDQEGISEIENWRGWEGWLRKEGGYGTVNKTKMKTKEREQSSCSWIFFLSATYSWQTYFVRVDIKFPLGFSISFIFINKNTLLVEKGINHI